MTITIEQAFGRTRTLPQQLRNAFLSDQTSEIIRQIIAQNNIPRIKSTDIAYSVGLVLLGFIHPEDLAKEIEERAGIAPQAATAIAQNINIKIFQPLRGILEQSYAPALREEEIEGPAPKIIEEIRKPEAVKTVPVPAPAKNATPPAVPIPPTTAKSVSENQKPPASKGILGEFARLGLDKLMGRSGVSAPTGGEPLPKIIQEEAVVKLSARAGLNIPIPPVPKLSETKASQKTPLRPVIMEMGSATAPAKIQPPKPVAPIPPKLPIPPNPPAPPFVKIQMPPPPEAKNQPMAAKASPVRIVHYSESRTPLAVPTNSEKFAVYGVKIPPTASPSLIPAPPKSVTPIPSKPPMPIAPSANSGQVPPVAPTPSRIEQAAMNLSSKFNPPPVPPKPPTPPEIKRANPNP